MLSNTSKMPGKSISLSAEKWQTAWVQKNTYKKFRRPDGTFDKKENWQLI